MLRSVINIKVFIFITLFSYSVNCYAKEASDDTYSYNYAALSGRCQVYDPYESINRKIFFVNGVLDTIITRPIAKVYGAVTNNYIKSRVGSFVSNIEEPLTTINYSLQGNPGGTFKSFWRFVINSTIGMAGLFDVAEKLNLKAEPQTFGNTLAYHGVGSGPYIVLPIFGGTSARNVGDSIASNQFLNPLKYYLHDSFRKGVTVGNVIHSRDAVMPFTDYVLKNSSDPYISIRDAIFQQQEARMKYPDGFKCPKVNN